MSSGGGAGVSQSTIDHELKLSTSPHIGTCRTPTGHWAEREQRVTLPMAASHSLFPRMREMLQKPREQLLAGAEVRLSQAIERRREMCKAVFRRVH